MPNLHAVGINARAYLEGGDSRRMAVSRCSRRLCLLLLFSLALRAGSKKEEKKKKNLLDLSEVDVHKIYEQWEVYMRAALSASSELCINS